MVTLLFLLGFGFVAGLVIVIFVAITCNKTDMPTHEEPFDPIDFKDVTERLRKAENEQHN